MYKLEQNEISLHEIKTYQTLKADPGHWFECWQIAKLTGIGKRTVAKHVVRFVELGLVEQAELWPTNKYQWRVNPDNQAYIARLEKAADIFDNVIKVELESP